MNTLDIAVVGGSLGGLTTAALLRDDGHRVAIYERSPVPLEQRGAGVGFLEATSRYLVDRAGVALDDISIETGNIRYLGRDGSVAANESHGYRFSSWNTIYRHLHDHWTGVAEGGEYHLDHELVSFEQDDHGVDLTFADGNRRRADLLVCADGVGSRGRDILQPQAEQSYAGYVAWRGMVPEGELSPATVAALDDAITYYVYANSHILVYPIPAVDGSLDRGRRLINFVWYRNYNEGEDIDDLMTDRRGEHRPLSVPPGAVADHHIAEARATAVARLPGPLAEVVTSTDELFVQAIFDIEVERVAFDRVCLLGDAAFAVRPHAAAGTAKACDDGWALAQALRGDDNTDEGDDPHVVDALRGWERRQMELGRNLLARTRAIGRRSQVDGTWAVGDPDLIFGLYRPGH